MNTGSYSAPLDMETKRELQALFAEDVLKVERLLGHDLNA